MYVFGPSAIEEFSCTEAVSGSGTDLEKFEEDAAEEVGEVWEKVALLVQKSAQRWWATLYDQTLVSLSFLGKMRM